MEKGTNFRPEPNLTLMDQVYAVLLRYHRKGNGRA